MSYTLKLLPKAIGRMSEWRRKTKHKRVNKMQLQSQRFSNLIEIIENGKKGGEYLRRIVLI